MDHDEVDTCFLNTKRGHIELFDNNNHHNAEIANTNNDADKNTNDPNCSHNRLCNNANTYDNYNSDNSFGTDHVEITGQRHYDDDCFAYKVGSCSEASVCDDNVLENNEDRKNLKPLINRANKIRTISEKYFGDTCDSTTVTNEDRREQHGINSVDFERHSSDHIFRCPIL